MVRNHPNLVTEVVSSIGSMEPRFIAAEPAGVKFINNFLILIIL